MKNNRGKNLRLWPNTYLGPGVVIEDNVGIGPNVVIGHAFNDDLQTEVPKATHIKSGTIIEAGAIIGPGLTIGEKAIIRMGTVVTRDIHDGEDYKRTGQKPPTIYDPKAWDTLPKEWDNSHTAGGFRDPQLNIMDWIIEHEPESVLDIGCCTGYYIEKLRELKYGGKYLGIDVTESFIKRGQELYPNESFGVGDIMNMAEYPDDSYDLVFAFGVFQHIPDHEKAMAEMFRVAKKHMIISVPYTDGDKTLAKHSDKFLGFQYARDDLVEHTPEGWELLREMKKWRHLQLLFKKVE